MATTLEKYGNAVRRNYETLPTEDVEILPLVNHCETCGGVVVFDQLAGHFGQWKHVDPDTPDHGVITPRTWCRYCHTNENVKYVQHPYHDAIECGRCGGKYGIPIGD